MIAETSTTNRGIYNKIRNILRRGAIFINAQKDRVIRQISLPDEFLRDLEDFEERNSLVEPKAAHIHGEGVCCNRCLKAYALARAREMNLDIRGIAPLILAMNCEAGHNGYFEDNGQLIALS